MQSKTRVSETRETSSDIEQRFSQLKRDLHQRLVQSIDLTALRTMEEQQLRQEFRKGAEELCRQRPDLLGLAERRRLIDELIDETLGLGPLETLLRDPTITDILINGPRQVFIERKGKLEPAGVTFHSDEHLLQVVQKIAGRVGRRIDESSPMVDARLADGSRVNAIIRPLALDGALVSIRRFGAQPPRPIDLLHFGAMSQEMLAFLAACIEARLNILISGGTGSGKTTLLNALSSFIAANQRIVTIEDAAELKLQQPHVARLETRPANAEGQGAVGPRELLRNALRMRPDRIIVGECRGDETLDMLQAMNTGHDGSLTTVHANSAPDALSRLQMLVGLAGSEIPMWYIDRQIASGIQLVVHVARLNGGVRKIVQIAELQNGHDGQLQTNDLFQFIQTGVNDLGEAQGHFRPTGAVPKCLERLRSCGLNMSAAFFQPITNSPAVARGAEV